MTTLHQIFDSNGESGVWTIAFPEVEYREYPLFETFDLYGDGLSYMRHTLELDEHAFQACRFTDAMLNFDLAGSWMALINRGYRIANGSKIRFRFSDIEDADMFKLFGIPGKVSESGR